MTYSKAFASIAISLVATSSILTAATKKADCQPTPPATCYPDDCCRTYCLGPENYGVNAAVNPRTCNGDWVISVQGLYWKAHQEGLDYAIINDSALPDWQFFLQYIDAEIETPHFDWNFGFRAGVGYNTTCDGWDLGVIWTWYQGKANSHIEVTQDNDSRLIIALLSNFGNRKYFPSVPEATADWKLNLNLADIELGREFWNSKRLALRPFIGFRFASIKQDYVVEYKGLPKEGTDPRQNSRIDMDNDFRGFGIRGGLNSVFNLGCGLGIYGDLAISILYGRFNIDINEQIRDAETPFTKQEFTDLDKSFRASRLMADLGIGIQWSSLFCDCNYGVTIALGWENHIFLNQNQLYRVNHVSPGTEVPQISSLQGDLDTQGWTLSATFEF